MSTVEKTRTVFGCKHTGGWKVKDPKLVAKVALIFDDYKEPMLEKMFREGFKKHANKELRKLGVTYKDLIWQEIQDYTKDGKLKLCFRYYTPKHNKERIKREGVEHEN